jgi:hypothetical protein
MFKPSRDASSRFAIAGHRGREQQILKVEAEIR